MNATAVAFLALVAAPFVYPLIAEKTAVPCLAAERILLRGGPADQKLPDGLIAEADGAFARVGATSAYPRLPPELACYVMYWREKARPAPKA